MILVRRNSFSRAIFALAISLLVGCDIAGSEKLSDPVLGGPGDGDSLDDTDSQNIAAYFYLDRPVRGLLFSCAVSGSPSIIGATDENGRFVCPRNTTATFFVGQQGVSTIRLGQVPLAIYGDGTSTDSLNFAVITPATLFGTGVDASRPEVKNIFNLLVSLDSGTSSASQRQAIINLEPSMIAHAATLDSFRRLAAAGLSSTQFFEPRLDELAKEIDGNPLYPLANGGGILNAAEAEALANKAFLRARSGIYRTVIANDDSLIPEYAVNAQFVIGNNGMANGFGSVLEILRSGGVTTKTLDLVKLAPTSQVLPDGALRDFTFSGPVGQIDFLGSIINDAIWGLERLCNANSPNVRVPALYCSTTPEKGGFEEEDAGSYRGIGTHEGQLYVSRALPVLPDLDLDNLSAGYLPRTFEMSLSRYTAVSKSNLNSYEYDAVTDLKDTFGAKVLLPSRLRYTILENGDIVSDMDSDCELLTLASDGHYYDAGNTREYLIGRAGNAFVVDLNTVAGAPERLRSYMTIQFSIVDDLHPFFGMTVGFPAMFRPGLHPMVLEERTGKVISKSCDPKSTVICSHRVEWFNDWVFIRDVSTEEFANPSMPADALNALYRDSVYYGQVDDNLPVLGSGGICPAAMPATP